MAYWEWLLPELRWAATASSLITDEIDRFAAKDEAESANKLHCF